MMHQHTMRQTYYTRRFTGACMLGISRKISFPCNIQRYNVIPCARMGINAPISSKPNTIINLTFNYEPFYRVILVYSNWIEDKLTAALVANAVKQLSYNDAIRIVRSAHMEGSAIVITAIKQEAAKYCDNLLKKGLDAYLEEA